MHLTLPVTEAPGANAYNISRLSYIVRVLVCKCFCFAFLICIFVLFCHVLFVLFCVLPCCLMHASVWISSSEALTSLTSSLQTLIEINSFDQLVTKTYPRLRRFNRCLLYFNEWSGTELNKEKIKKFSSEHTRWNILTKADSFEHQHTWKSSLASVVSCAPHRCIL